MKKCNKCGETKPLSEYHKHRKGTKGVQSWCKACMLERRRSVLNKTKMKRPTEEEETIRSDKSIPKMIIKNGGTASGGKRFIVIDTERLKEADIKNLFNKEYIERGADDLFNFILDNVPSSVFKLFAQKIKDYTTRIERFEDVA